MRVFVREGSVTIQLKATRRDFSDQKRNWDLEINHNNRVIFVAECFGTAEDATAMLATGAPRGYFGAGDFGRAMAVVERYVRDARVPGPAPTED